MDDSARTRRMTPANRLRRVHCELATCPIIVVRTCCVQTSPSHPSSRCAVVAQVVRVANRDLKENWAMAYALTGIVGIGYHTGRKICMDAVRK